MGRKETVAQSCTLRISETVLWKMSAVYIEVTKPSRGHWNYDSCALGPKEEIVCRCFKAKKSAEGGGYGGWMGHLNSNLCQGRPLFASCFVLKVNVGFFEPWLQSVPNLNQVVLSHTSSVALGLTMLVCLSAGWSTTLVRNEISQQPSNGFSWRQSRSPYNESTDFSSCVTIS